MVQIYRFNGFLDPIQRTVAGCSVKILIWILYQFRVQTVRHKSDPDPSQNARIRMTLAKTLISIITAKKIYFQSFLCPIKFISPTPWHRFKEI